VLEVGVSELDRLEVVGLHVFEEPDVDAAAPGMVVLGHAPADDAANQAQSNDEHERLRERRQPAPTRGRSSASVGVVAGVRASTSVVVTPAMLARRERLRASPP
jgi:hypothetical protein